MGVASLVCAFKKYVQFFLNLTEGTECTLGSWGPQGLPVSPLMEAEGSSSNAVAADWSAERLSPNAQELPLRLVLCCVASPLHHPPRVQHTRGQGRSEATLAKHPYLSVREVDAQRFCVIRVAPNCTWEMSSRPPLPRTGPAWTQTPKPSVTVNLPLAARGPGPDPWCCLDCWPGHGPREVVYTRKHSGPLSLEDCLLHQKPRCARPS